MLQTVGRVSLREVRVVNVDAANVDYRVEGAICRLRCDQTCDRSVAKLYVAGATCSATGSRCRLGVAGRLYSLNIARGKNSHGKADDVAVACAGCVAKYRI